MSSTIFALATSGARSALHIHRISGPGVFDKVLKHLEFKEKTQWGPQFHGRAIYTKVISSHGEFIDDGVAVFFFGPHSFTGEDTLEFTCHGNPLISSHLQGCWRGCGFVEAKPGEFTLRAFLNGKCDLSQAEAIGEIIHAKTHKGLELAQRANSKDLQKFIGTLKDKLVQSLAYLEAHIDFAPDEVGHFDQNHALALIGDVESALGLLDKSYRWGAQVRSGLNIVICGFPNAGKSTLFNALLGYERAIVTDLEGTTRDTLGESLMVGGRDFVLVDTAGIRKSGDLAEQLGIERSFQALESAQVALAVLDATRFVKAPAPIEALVFQDLEEFGFGKIPAAWIVVFSKTDLLTQEQLNKILDFTNILKAHENVRDWVFTGLNEFEGLKQCLMKVYDQLMAWDDQPPCPILLSQRQLQLVQQAVASVQEAKECVSSGGYPESVASLLITANHTLEDIIGGYSVESIYTQIFSTFCIGK